MFRGRCRDAHTWFSLHFRGLWVGTRLEPVAAPGIDNLGAHLEARLGCGSGTAVP